MTCASPGVRHVPWCDDGRYNVKTYTGRIDLITDPPMVDPLRVLPIVVGAHLIAERDDRPLAYRVRNRIRRWLADGGGGRPGVQPLVCCDVWYLNQDDLQRRPTISIGSPRVQRLKRVLPRSTLVGVGTRRSAHGPARPAVCGSASQCVGVTHDLTVEALEVFRRQYLEGFLRAAVGEMESRGDS